MANITFLVGPYLASSGLFYIGWLMVCDAVARENAIPIEEWDLF
jgi:hypothetical protein